MADLQRWPAFSLSVILHIAAVGFIVWIDIAFPSTASTQYEAAVAPDQALHDHKIIWYDFRKAVPEVTPEHPFGPFKTPHGEKDPRQTLVTVAPNASSIRQLIRRPDHPELLPADVPAPNLVAVNVRLPPKAFVPPPVPERPKTAAPAAIEAPPSIDLRKAQTGNALGAIVSLQKLPPKPFVAPPARGSEARVAPHVDVPAAVSSLDSQANPMPGLQAVLVGLNPAAALPPPGSRSAQIARAPEAGTPSSGVSLGPGTPVVPGLLSHGKPGEPSAPVPVPVPSNPERRVPQEIVLPPINRTMSAPLRPSSRVIPAAIEAQFARRNVYTLVIPGPALPGYGGDWVMWFAPRGAEADGVARISAPVPARRYSLVKGDPQHQGFPAPSTVQFAAIIDKAGHIGSAIVLRGPADPAFRTMALEELGSWEFKPAQRNGEPMDVDVVIEIPFRFQLTSQTHQ